MGCLSVSIAVTCAARPDAAGAAVVYYDPPDITARVTSVPPLFTTVVDTAPVDVDLDGVHDIAISAARHRYFIANDVSAWAEPLRPGPVVAGDGFEAARLTPPEQIGPGRAFQADPAYFALSDSTATSWYGQWAGGDTGLAGMRFDRAGQTHYGWMRIRFEVSMPDLLPAVSVLDWAWETQPDTPIVAGAVPAPGVVAALFSFSLLAVPARRRTPGQGGTL